MRARMTVVGVVGAVCALGLTGCGGQPSDDMQIGTSAVAATPAASPQQTGKLKGTLLPVKDHATAVAVDQSTGTLAVAVAAGKAVLLYSLRELTAAPKRVALGGDAVELDAVAPGVLQADVGEPGRLVTIRVPAGTTQVTEVKGGPVSTAAYRGATVVALRDHQAVGVVRDGRLQQLVSGGLYSADQVFVTPNGVAVLDRRRTAVFDVDLDKGQIGAGLRAGLGAANAVVDRYGRILMTDTRGGALLAFTVNPMLLRQNYPVPGAPYAIAYDPVRDLAWVTLTSTNEVVGYNVAGGEPTEKYRFATVRQPNAVAVDPADGRVIVASGDGAGVQVVEP